VRPIVYAVPDLLSISVLQFLASCQQQWALIRVEGVWTVNRLTVEEQHFMLALRQQTERRAAGLREMARASKTAGGPLLEELRELLAFEPVRANDDRRRQEF